VEFAGVYSSAPALKYDKFISLFDLCKKEQLNEYVECG